MSSETKVAMFLPNLGGGGAERVAVHLSNALADRGYRVDLVLAEAKGAYLADVSPRVNMVDLRSRRMIGAVLPLARYLRKAKPDVLFSHLDYANVAALLAKTLSFSRVRVFPVVHVIQSHARARANSSKDALMRMAIRRVYPRAAGIVAVSRGCAEDLVRMSGVPSGRVSVIYNPVIGPALRAGAERTPDHRWLTPGGPDVIISAGRLAVEKDFATLIRGFALLQKKRDCRLLILGEGAERGALEKLIQTLGVNEKVDMPGFVQNPFSYMSRGALFALSSSSEALPTVLIEALALGLPVVATDCPTGPREILLDGKLGSLVPVGDAESLARAMDAALGMPRRPAPADALAPFTLPVAVDAYAGLISGNSR